MAHNHAAPAENVQSSQVHLNFSAQVLIIKIKKTNPTPVLGGVAATALLSLSP